MVRASLAVLIVILLASSVSAVSLLVPTSEDVLLEVNEQKLFEFSVRGDGSNVSLRAFVRSDVPILTFDTKSSFEKNVTLSGYNMTKLSVLLRAVGNGTAHVEYGFVIPGGSGGISFDQVTKNAFDVVVLGVSNTTNTTTNTTNMTNMTTLKNYTVVVTTNPVGATVYVDGSNKGSSPVNVVLTQGAHTFKATRTGYYDASLVRQILSNQTVALTLTESSSGSGSGGGGGGGGGGSSTQLSLRRNMTNTTNTTTVQKTPVVPVVQPPPVIQDIGVGDGSGIAEGVVNDVPAVGVNTDRPVAPPPQIQATDVEETSGSPGLSKNGKLLGAFLVIMLISMTIVSGFMYRAAKKEA